MVAILVNTDKDTCEINSPFSSSRSSSSSSSSSSEEEEVIQPELGRGRKRIRRALPKRKDTDFELGWKEQIQMVQKPAFSGVPGINKKFSITQDSSPWEIYELFFSSEMFKHMQKETNRYAKQKKKLEGLLPPKSVFARWNKISLQEIKKILCNNHTHEPLTQVISAGLLDFASDYSYPICIFCWDVSE